MEISTEAEQKTRAGAKLADRGEKEKRRAKYADGDEPSMPSKRVISSSQTARDQLEDPPGSRRQGLGTGCAPALSWATPGELWFAVSAVRCPTGLYVFHVGNKRPPRAPRAWCSESPRERRWTETINLSRNQMRSPACEKGRIEDSGSGGSGSSRPDRVSGTGRRSQAKRTYRVGGCGTDGTRTASVWSPPVDAVSLDDMQ